MPYELAESYCHALHVGHTILPWKPPRTPRLSTAACALAAPAKLTSPESIARGYSKACAAKVRAAAKAADLSQWTPSQVEDARQAIEDGAVVPSNREGVFHVVSTDGSEVHLTHRDGCNCTSGLQTLPPRPCWHRCAVAIVLASQVPVLPIRNSLGKAA